MKSIYTVYRFLSFFRASSCPLVSADSVNSFAKFLFADPPLLPQGKVEEILLDKQKYLEKGLLYSSNRMTGCLPERRCKTFKLPAV